MNLLIVDDEPAVRVALKQLCERTTDVRVIGEAGTGARAIEAMGSLRPDLTFLDADLPDMSGYDVLRALRPRHQRRTVLVTGQAEDAENAFAAGAIDHLVKPINEAAVCTTVLRARARGVFGARATSRMPAIKEAPPRTPSAVPLLLVGEREHRLYPVDPCHIDYVESAGNYVTYHQSGIAYIARESIKRLGPLLASIGFVRIQRSLLLNVRSIAYAQPIGRGSFAFTLVSGERLQSSDTFRDTILAALPLRRRTPATAPRLHSRSD